MTHLATQILGLVAAGAVAAGGAIAGTADDPSPRTALVIDAGAARDGRELIDPRLEELDAELRLPRTDAEARTNVRYFDELGYRVVVGGPSASAAARTAGVDAARAHGIDDAVAAAAR
jgi:hypothetical protein